MSILKSQTCYLCYLEQSAQTVQNFLGKVSIPDQFNNSWLPKWFLSLY